MTVGLSPLRDVVRVWREMQNLQRLQDELMYRFYLRPTEDRPAHADKRARHT